MGYYTINISPASQDMTAIVSEFGKCRYNCLPMVMCDPGGIFQDKIDELLGNIDEINIYIDDVLVLFKESFYNHTDQLIFILPRLRAVG